MTLTSHVLANPTGKRYSYCVRVRGLPQLWDDGRATWDPSVMDLGGIGPDPTVMKGGLMRAGWTFTFESNPMEPLDVGGGITIELAADAAGVTRSLFAPQREVEAIEPIVTEIAADTTTIEFVSMPTSMDDAGKIIYAGLETVVVDSATGAELTVTRGCFGSVPRPIRGYFEGSGDGYEMVKFTDYPTVWRGRYVDVWMGEILDDGTIGDTWKVWAGRLEAFDVTTKCVRLSCDPLTAAIQKDYWPRALGECSTGTDTLNILLRPDDLYLRADAFETGTRARVSGIRYPLGVYNSAGVFTEIDATAWDAAGEWFTLDEVTLMLRDTLVAAGLDQVSGAGEWLYLYNNFSITTESYDNGRAVTLSYSNDTYIGFKIREFGPLNSFLAGAGGNNRYETIDPQSSGPVINAGFIPNGYVIDQFAGKIQALPNDSRFYPNVSEGCYHDVANEMRAYVAVSNGKDTELVSINSVGIAGDGIVTLEVAERGLGGTRQRSWGGLVDGDLTNVTIKQVCAVRTGEDMDVSDVLLYLLTSIAGSATQVNGPFDYLGPATGLGIPEDLIDVAGIQARLALGDMPRPSMFWVEDAGKGKDALANFMKFHGIYFVTRRFTAAGGQERFGLSVDVVDVPASTRYNLSITDSHIAAHDEPRFNINERLIINQIAVSPRYEFGVKDQDQGGKRYAYAERSIRKYGASKVLELGASTLFTTYSSRFGGAYQDEASVATAVALQTGLRWFGAFSDGNYTITATMPHVGWAVQPGDRVKLTLTNIANPQGTNGLSNVVAKVVDVKHKHGSPGADVTLRVSQIESVELAPCFRVASSSGSTITLTDNAFSFDDGLPPFDTDTSPPYDGQWFNYDRHGAGLRITVWEQGNYAGAQTYTVTGSTFSGGNWTLTLNTTFSATLAGVVTTGNVPVIGTFAPYANAMSSLRSQYAYIGSNDRPSVLGSLDGTLDDVEANRWR